MKRFVWWYVRAHLKFYMDESCGQCTPCREGTGWLYRFVHRIEHNGRGETATYKTSRLCGAPLKLLNW